MTGQTIWHRCDVAIDETPEATPTTTLRVLRLIRALLNGPDIPAFAGGFDELGECPKCLRHALTTALGFCAKVMADQSTDAVMVLEIQIAAVEAQIEAGQ